MDKDQELILESQTFRNDYLNQKIPGEKTTRTILCAERSITRAEWSAAAQNGLKASYCLVVWSDEYNGETIAVYKGSRFSIYRTFRPNTEETELYLEQKAGV